MSGNSAPQSPLTFPSQYPPLYTCIIVLVSGSYSFWNHSGTWVASFSSIAASSESPAAAASAALAARASLLRRLLRCFSSSFCYMYIHHVWLCKRKRGERGESRVEKWIGTAATIISEKCGSNLVQVSIFSS